jgi:hypothetical protein
MARPTLMESWGLSLMSPTVQAVILTWCGFRATTHPRHTVAQQSLPVSIEFQQHDPQQLVRCVDALFHPSYECSACKGCFFHRYTTLLGICISCMHQHHQSFVPMLELREAAHHLRSCMGGASFALHLAPSTASPIGLHLTRSCIRRVSCVTAVCDMQTNQYNLRSQAWLYY